MTLWEDKVTSWPFVNVYKPIPFSFGKTLCLWFLEVFRWTCLSFPPFSRINDPWSLPFSQRSSLWSPPSSPGGIPSRAEEWTCSRASSGTSRTVTFLLESRCTSQVWRSSRKWNEKKFVHVVSDSHKVWSQWHSNSFDSDELSCRWKDSVWKCILFIQFYDTNCPGKLNLNRLNFACISVILIT